MFGPHSAPPGRWMLGLVLIAVVLGIAFGSWVFSSLT
jgi:hypothetical protein